jgi:hypothetical protein
MRKTIVGFIFVFVLAFNISAQTNEARQIDELAEFRAVILWHGWTGFLMNYKIRLIQKSMLFITAVEIEGKIYGIRKLKVSIK